MEGQIRIPREDSAVIPEPAKAQLGPLVEKLNTDYVLRVQVLAYAGGDEDASSHARGVSLARALAMRNYLSSQGIDHGRAWTSRRSATRRRRNRPTGSISCPWRG